MTLKFDFQPSEYDGDSAEDRTRGRLVVTISGRTVWDFVWTWIELLEHLSHNWHYLMWEESCPLPLDVGVPGEIRRKAVEVMSREPTSDAEEDAFATFCDAHELSRGLQGVWPAELWVLRRGARFHVWSKAAEEWVTEPELRASLDELGQTLIPRLEGSRDPRAGEACAAWKSRNEISALDFVTASTGLESTIVTEVAGEAIEEVFELTGEGNELLAVARMIGAPVSAELIRTTLESVRGIEKRTLPDLDRLSADCCGALGSERKKPFEQGEDAARWLRSRLGARGRAEPRAILEQWNVILAETRTDPSLDAICVWGRRHGPAVLLNRAGRHAQSPAGERSSLAHEIGHILLDRGDALPFAEVFGGRVPEAIEQRARAFSAELLLPRAEVLEAFKEATLRNQPIDRLVESLAVNYGTSREIVAWQLKKSGAELSNSEKTYLRRFVSRPDLF
ncbi:MAG: ImmA/IrrE family metallo-endopeptidase [Deltaproteobacteria bacterium]|nr:ImmA/IrrE family metallo-endopeptidase [Deltaproteobacteria bacterium]